MATGANQSTRQWLNTSDPNAIRIRYRAPINPVFKTYMTICGILNPCNGMLCKKEEIFQSTYVQVHENRLEVNYPNLRSCCVCKKVDDAVGVYYFDSRFVAHYGKAGVCTPLCTHNSCFPTCFGLCGEAVIFYNSSCCCKLWFSTPFLMSADALIQQVDEAKNARPGGVPQPAPGVMNMAAPVDPNMAMAAGAPPMGTPMM